MLQLLRTFYRVTGADANDDVTLRLTVFEPQKDDESEFKLRRLLRRKWDVQTRLDYLQTAAAKGISMGYVADNVHDIFIQIKRVMSQAFNKRLAQAHHWVETLLSRCLHHVTAFLTRTRFSADELAAKQTLAEERLARIKAASETVMHKLEKQLFQSMQSIAIELSKYLASEKAKCKMGAWQLQQLPFADNDTSWPELESKLNNILDGRLLNVMCDWDTRTQLLLGARKDLLRRFKTEFYVLENELEMIEHIVESNHWSFTDAAVNDVQEFSSWVDNSNFDFKMSKFQKISAKLRK